MFFLFKNKTIEAEKRARELKEQQLAVEAKEEAVPFAIKSLAEKKDMDNVQKELCLENRKKALQRLKEYKSVREYFYRNFLCNFRKVIILII